MSADFRVLFEDPHLVILSKEAGLLSQSDISGEESLVDQLRVYVGRHYVGLVHRLDRNTSGLMVVAKRTKAASRLTEALQKGELKRSYLAIVLGTPPKEGRLENWLLKDELSNLVKVVPPETSESKKAILTYKCLAQGDFQAQTLSLLHVELETGRSHQIRVQCAHAGWPLVGDVKYGSPTAAKLCSRPALHSYILEFPHPMSKEVLTYKDTLPDDLRKFFPKEVL